MFFNKASGIFFSLKKSCFSDYQKKLKKLNLSKNRHLDVVVGLNLSPDEALRARKAAGHPDTGSIPLAERILAARYA